MEKLFNTVTNVLKKLIELMLLLLIVGVIVGLVFNDQFNVLKHIGEAVKPLGNQGMGALLTLFLIVVLYHNRKT
jgi:hypothetical protein